MHLLQIGPPSDLILICGSGTIVGGLLPDMWSTTDLLAAPETPHFGQLTYMCPTSVIALPAVFWMEANLPDLREHLNLAPTSANSQHTTFCCSSKISFLSHLQTHREDLDLGFLVSHQKKKIEL